MSALTYDEAAALYGGGGPRIDAAPPVGVIAARQAEASGLATQRRRAVLLRLGWRDGRTEQELARSLGWPVGTGAVLRELAEDGLVHERDGRWWRGPAPREDEMMVETVDPAVLPDRQRTVYRDVQAHPGTTAAEVRARTGLPRGTVSSVLHRLRATDLVWWKDGRYTATEASDGHEGEEAAPARARQERGGADRSDGADADLGHVAGGPAACAPEAAAAPAERDPGGRAGGAASAEATPADVAGAAPGVGGDEHPVLKRCAQCHRTTAGKPCCEEWPYCESWQRKQERRACVECGQVPGPSVGGEYPCLVCGLPTLHDDAPAPEGERQKDAHEEALDRIAALCGCPHWEYPGQVVRDVVALHDRATTAEATIEQQAHALGHVAAQLVGVLQALGAGPVEEGEPVALARRALEVASEAGRKAKSTPADPGPCPDDHVVVQIVAYVDVDGDLCVRGGDAEIPADDWPGTPGSAVRLRLRLRRPVAAEVPTVDLRGVTCG